MAIGEFGDIRCGGVAGQRFYLMIFGKMIQL
jgi:hypothetical protein